MIRFRIISLPFIRLKTQKLGYKMHESVMLSVVYRGESSHFCPYLSFYPGESTDYCPERKA
jgi:hypothetical protein